MMQKPLFFLVLIFLSFSSWSQTICLTEMESEVINLINTKRREAGLNEVVVSKPLMLLANKNMQEIATQSYLVYKPGEITGTEYTGEIASIRTTTSNNTSVRIVSSFTYASQYNNYYQILFNKDAFSSSNWKSIGVCIRPVDDGFTGVYIIFGETVQAALSPEICTTGIYFDTDVKTDPVLKLKIKEEVPGSNPSFACYLYFTDEAGKRTRAETSPYFVSHEENFMYVLNEPGVVKYELEIYPQYDPVVPQKATKISITTFTDDTLFREVTLYGNSVKEVEALLATGYGIDQSEPDDPFQFTMLHRAFMRDNFDVIEFLLSKHADLNKFSKGHELPLSFCQSDAVFNLALKYKPLLTYTSATGGNLLHSFSYFGSLAGVKYLADQLGFDVNAIDSKENQTALNNAVSENHYDIAVYLLSKGANPNVKSWGSYPIQTAVFHRNLEMVKLLVDSGANCDVTNEYGQTPYDVAKNDAELYKKPEILNYFDSKGIGAR
jgi:uncharacterized protein